MMVQGMTFTTNDDLYAPSSEATHTALDAFLSDHASNDLIISRMLTLADNETIRRACQTHRLDLSDETVEAAIHNMRSGRVASAVFSGKLASGKDAIAEQVCLSLAERGLAPGVVHRTSDPIRSELNAIIEIVKTSVSQSACEERIAASLDLTRDMSRYFTTMLWGPVREGPLVAEDRTDLNRTLLVVLADEGRRSADPDYWIRKFFSSMLTTLASGRSAYLTGGRYPNEIGPAQALGITTVRLIVSADVQARRLGSRDGLEANPILINSPNERALDDFVGFNLVFNNDGELHTGVALVSQFVEYVAHLTAHVRY